MGKHKNRQRGRANKRQAEQLTKTVQQFYTTLNESFVSKMVEHSFNIDSPEVKIAFENHNEKWKHFARGIITKYPNNYPKEQGRREKFLAAFETFVERAYKKVDQPIQAMSQPEAENQDMETLDQYSPEAIADALSRAGVKTRAKTIKGLTKVVEGLNEEQNVKFKELLRVT